MADGSEGVDGRELLCGGLDGADGVGQDPGAALSSQLVLLVAPDIPGIWH